MLRASAVASIGGGASVSAASWLQIIDHNQAAFGLVLAMLGLAVQVCAFLHGARMKAAENRRQEVEHHERMRRLRDGMDWE